MVSFHTFAKKEPMIRLSVNINKIATLRNARGGNIPDVQQVAVDCQRFGAQGITVHPRPDERHIRYKDVELLRPLVTTEFNIEGNPIPKFIDLVLKYKPDQVTLVPDDPDQLTSDHGWDIKKNKTFLTDVIGRFKAAGIRTSIFVDPDTEMIEHAVATGTDRVELYTEGYASGYKTDREKTIRPFVEAAEKAREVGLELNAGHDLNLENLHFFAQNIPWIKEVSIGHALIADALYFGLQNTIQLYLRALRTDE
jgi:pyridoxine 5-phosphate synthase